MTTQFTENELKLIAPFCAVIGGQSGSGKTTLLIKIVENNKSLMSIPPKSILYCYGQYNDSIPSLQKLGVRIHAGLPTEELIDRMSRLLLLLLDDLMIQISGNREFLANLFTRKSHHSNISIIFLTQNLFEKNMKIVRDNCHYIWLLNSPSAALQIRSLGTQIFPGNNFKFFLDSYRQAVSQRRFGYLLIDLHPASVSSLRLRTDLFKEAEHSTIFLPE